MYHIFEAFRARREATGSQIVDFVQRLRESNSVNPKIASSIVGPLYPSPLHDFVIGFHLDFESKEDMATFFEHVPAAHKSHFANGPLLPPPIRFEYDDEAMEIEPEPIFVLRDPPGMTAERRENIHRLGEMDAAALGAAMGAQLPLETLQLIAFQYQLQAR